MRWAGDQPVSRTAVLVSDERFSIEPTVVGDPGAGEIRIRIHECGICGSDLKMAAGKHPTLRAPLRLGHELYGDVEALGDGVAASDELALGKSVVLFPPTGCGLCEACVAGLPGRCEEMKYYGGDLAGGLAEHMIVAADNVLPIREGVPRATRALIEPLAVAVHALQRAGETTASDRAIVLGAGPIGIFVALALRARGASAPGTIILADRSAQRLELARGFGFERTLNVDTVDLVAAVRTEFGIGVELAFECVGDAAVARQALELTRKGGRVALVGLEPRELLIDGVLLQRGERSLIGVQMYSRDDFRTAMSLLESGLITDAMLPRITRSFALEDIEGAFDVLRSGSVLKPLVKLFEPSHST